MARHELMADERLEMLKWVSKRNMHIPLSDLAFMLDLNENAMESGRAEPGDKSHDFTD